MKRLCFGHQKKRPTSDRHTQPERSLNTAMVLKYCTFRCTFISQILCHFLIYFVLDSHALPTGSRLLFPHTVTYTLSNSSPFGGVRSWQTLTGPETQHDRIRVTDQLTVCGLLTHTTQILRDGWTTRGSEEMEKDSGWRSGEQRGWGWYEWRQRTAAVWRRETNKHLSPCGDGGGDGGCQFWAAEKNLHRNHLGGKKYMKCSQSVMNSRERMKLKAGWV